MAENGPICREGTIDQLELGRTEGSRYCKVHFKNDHPGEIYSLEAFEIGDQFECMSLLLSHCFISNANLRFGFMNDKPFTIVQIKVVGGPEQSKLWKDSVEHYVLEITVSGRGVGAHDLLFSVGNSYLGGVAAYLGYEPLLKMTGPVIEAFMRQSPVFVESAIVCGPDGLQTPRATRLVVTTLMPTMPISQPCPVCCCVAAKGA